MKTIDTMKKYQSSKIRWCPVCSSAMREIARLSDNGSALVWYSCSHDSCSGRWMQEECNLSLHEALISA